MGKKYHTPTSAANRMQIDPDVHRIAAYFIGGSNLFTPESEAKLDELIGIGTPATHCKPSLAFLAAENETNWFNDEPSDDAFEFDK